jgi:hypothetical protein
MSSDEVLELAVRVLPKTKIVPTNKELATTAKAVSLQTRPQT